MLNFLKDELKTSETDGQIKVLASLSQWVMAELSVWLRLYFLRSDYTDVCIFRPHDLRRTSWFAATQVA